MFKAIFDFIMTNFHLSAKYQTAFVQLLRFVKVTYIYFNNKELFPKLTADICVLTADNYQILQKNFV